MKNPTVWIIKEQVLRGDTGPAPIDYSPAMDFGDLEFVTSHDMPMYSKSTMQDQWNRSVVDFVNKYDEARDYIVATGQPMAICQVGVALGHARKSPRYLVWRREQGRYIVVTPGPIVG